MRQSSGTMTVMICAYVEQELYNTVEKMADADNRSMSYIVREAVIEYAKRRKVK